MVFFLYNGQNDVMGKSINKCSDAKTLHVFKIYILVALFIYGILFDIACHFFDKTSSKRTKSEISRHNPTFFKATLVS